jgi:serine/tyrosine/threonine adenylyltransferase
MPIAFDNTYARELTGAYVSVAPQGWAEPDLVILNTAWAAHLGLDADYLQSPDGVAMLSGHSAPATAQPIAQAYAGHQFGSFNPQLGDGRAYLLGEVVAPDGTRHDIHLKGSGRTPFSRGGDGRAVLGPVLREYLVSEAVAALGIPTTRALAACTTGDRVLRQHGLEPGAVLARSASSHLRVGTLQFFAARGQADMVARVADYAIARHDPDLTGTEGRYLAFLSRVGARQAQLVAQWMGLGFVHGVMNTDNCTLSGETIDYGPCAFMDSYDPATVFSSIDHGGRYAYGNQPGILLWNMSRLAEALLPLIDPDQDSAIALATEAVEGVQDKYRAAWLDVFARKLGFEGPCPEGLVDGLHSLLTGQRADFTGFFRALPDAVLGDDSALMRLFTDGSGVAGWLAKLRASLQNPDTAAERMRAVNPIYIPRNHLVEHALEAASDQGDLNPFLSLLEHVQKPFTLRDGSEAFAEPAPDSAPKVVTFCGT